VTYRFVKESSLRLFQLWLFFVAIFRGISLIVNPDSTIMYLGWSAAIDPAWVWGVFTISLGALGFLGEWWMEWGSKHYRWILSFSAHAGLAGVYLVYGVSSMNYAIQGRGEPSVATALEVLGYAFCHAIFVNRRSSA
jgi:hypothetical protein